MAACFVEWNTRHTGPSPAMILLDVLACFCWRFCTQVQTPDLDCVEQAWFASSQLHSQVREAEELWPGQDDADVWAAPGTGLQAAARATASSHALLHGCCTIWQCPAADLRSRWRASTSLLLANSWSVRQSAKGWSLPAQPLRAVCGCLLLTYSVSISVCV